MSKTDLEKSMEWIECMDKSYKHFKYKSIVAVSRFNKKLTLTMDRNVPEENGIYEFIDINLYLKQKAEIERLRLEANYDEWKSSDTGLSTRQRVVNCPDCKTRVKTYLESTEAFQKQNAKLLKLVESVKGHLKEISLCSLGTDLKRETIEKILRDEANQALKLIDDTLAGMKGEI